MAATDTQAGFLQTPSSPAMNAVAVSPSDTVDFGFVSRGIYVGVTGNVVAVMQGTGGAITFTAVQAGSILPIRVTRVNATSTTATNMVALY